MHPRHRDARPVGATAPAAAASERYLVPALLRGLTILKSFSGQRSRQSLTEVAAALHVTRSSAYRLLVTLHHMGFVTFDAETKTYALGAEALTVGYGYLAARDLVEVATPHLLRLRDRTGWSAHLGELHGRDVVYLARVPTRRSVASTVHIGTRLPARFTTMGRVLLSHLPPAGVRDLYRDAPAAEVGRKGTGGIDGLIEQLDADRAAGVVVAQRSDYEPGVASIAAPIQDVAGHVVAAINISAIALLTSEAELVGSLRTEVLNCAAAISRDLGYRPAANIGSAREAKTARPPRRAAG